MKVILFIVAITTIAYGLAPTPEPTVVPTPEPTIEPSASPTSPTSLPTSFPSTQPTPLPSPQPTPLPSPFLSSAAPTAESGSNHGGYFGNGVGGRNFVKSLLGFPKRQSTGYLIQNIFIYMIIFGLFGLVLRALINLAMEEVRKPRPVVKDDDFLKEYGYSYDWVIVFKVFNEDDISSITDFMKKFSMKKVVDRLLIAGFETQCFYSCQRDELYLKMRCPPERIKEAMHRVKYKVRLNYDRLKAKAQTGRPGVWGKIDISDDYQLSCYDPWENIYGPYSMDPDMQYIFQMYEFDEGRKHPFRQVDRLKLMKIIMETNLKDRGAGLNLSQMLDKNACLAVLVLHDYETLNELQKKWLKLVDYPWNQPVDEIKDYFGERLGLFFLFLGYYCESLLIPGAVGAVVYIVQVIYGGPECVLYPPFGVVMMVWSTVFVDLWKERQSRAAVEWGCYGFESEEVDRPAFKGQDINSPVDGKKFRYVSEEERTRKSNRANATVTACIICVVCVVAGTYVVRWYMTQPENVAKFTVSIGPISINTGLVITPILNTVVILIANILYTDVAYSLTEYENHRTETLYENALISKIFVFQLVNTFAALTYVGFIAHFLDFSCTNGNCTGDIVTSLSTIYISQILTTMISDIFVRKQLQSMELAKQTNGLEPGVKASPIELQYSLDIYDVLRTAIIDYAGLVINFGYIVLFTTAFPLSCTLACAFIYIKIRVEAWKMCQCYRRPMPLTAEDIGMWQDMIEIIAALAVTYNMGLIFFTGYYLIEYTWPMRWIMFILSEHALFALKFYVQAIIDDMADEVAIQLKRQDFLVDKVLSNIPDEIEDEDEDSGREPVNIIINRTDNGWMTDDFLEEAFGDYVKKKN